MPLVPKTGKLGLARIGKHESGPSGEIAHSAGGQDLTRFGPAVQRRGYFHSRTGNRRAIGVRALARVQTCTKGTCRSAAWSLKAHAQQMARAGPSKAASKREL